MSAPRMLVRAALLSAAVVVLVLLTWAWNKTRSVDPEEHARIDSALRELRSLDRTINQDILQARYQFIDSYDPVRRSYRRIEELESMISNPPDYLDKSFRARLQAAVARYRSAVTAKQHLIEDFKYRSMNLKELLAYLPGAGTGVAKAASGNGEEALAAAVNRVLQQTLLYNLTSDDQYAPLIRSQIDALEIAGQKTQSYLLKRRVRTLVINIRRLLTVKPDVDRDLRRIFEQPVTTHEENVAGIYYGGYAAAERVASRYRVLLYALCIVLLGLIAYAVARLQRTARALAISNEGLESRVAERTSELDTRNQELKRVLDDVARSEEGFRSLIEHSFDGIAVHRNGVIVYATAALAAYLRRSKPADLVGSPAAELVPESRRADFNDSSRAIEGVGQRTLMGEMWITDADGQPKPVEVSSVGAMFDGSLAVVTLFRDLSERKRLEEQQIALAKSERERLAKELEIARRIQVSLLPHTPAARGLEIAARMVPATEVGGDYYDLIPTGDSCWIGIGDVAGHGLDAGLIMLMCQSTIAALTRHSPQASPCEVLAAVNEVLYDNLWNRHAQRTFVTLALMHYDGAGGFTFAGGHEDLVVFRAATGRCERVETPGPWLGAGQSVERTLILSTLRLEPGDVMVLYTDGITEARNGNLEQFGIHRICELLEENPQAPVQQVCDELFDRVGRWQAEQEDDLTAMVIRYRPAS